MSDQQQPTGPIQVPKLKPSKSVRKSLIRKTDASPEPPGNTPVNTINLDPSLDIDNSDVNSNGGVTSTVDSVADDDDFISLLTAPLTVDEVVKESARIDITELDGCDWIPQRGSNQVPESGLWVTDEERDRFSQSLLQAWVDLDDDNMFVVGLNNDDRIINKIDRKVKGSGRLVSCLSASVTGNSSYKQKEQDPNGSWRETGLRVYSYQGPWKNEPDNKPGFVPTLMTIQDFADHISTGHAYSCAIRHPHDQRKNAATLVSWTIAADIDSGMTLDDALVDPFISEHACLIIESASSTPAHNKFRIVFRFVTPILGHDQVTMVARYIMHVLKVADKQCKDSARFFYGARGKLPILMQPDARLPETIVDDALAHWERVKSAAKKKTGFAGIAGDETYTLLLDAMGHLRPRDPGTNQYEKLRAIITALTNAYGTDVAIDIVEQTPIASNPAIGWEVDAIASWAEDTQTNYDAETRLGIGYVFHCCMYVDEIVDAAKGRWQHPGKSADKIRVKASEIDETASRIGSLTVVDKFGLTESQADLWKSFSVIDDPTESNVVQFVVDAYEENSNVTDWKKALMVLGCTERREFGTNTTLYRKLVYAFIYHREILSGAKEPTDKQVLKDVEHWTITLITDYVNDCLRNERYDILQSITGDEYLHVLKHSKDESIVQLHDIRLILDHVQRDLWWNEMTREVCTTDNGRTVTVEDSNNFRAEMMDRRGYNPRQRERAFHHTLLRASQRDSRHPIREYLENCEGIGRDEAILENLADQIFLTDEPLYNAYLRSFLVDCVRVIFEPGCSVRQALILTNAGKIGKTGLFRALCPDWYNELHKLPGGRDKDDKMELAHSWVHCLDEIDQYIPNSKQGRERFHAGLKALITATKQLYRAPYAQRPSYVPRSYMIMGTTNKVEGLFPRSEGNDRFMIVDIKRDPFTERGMETFDFDWIYRHRDAIWGAAVRLYRQGYDTMLTREQLNRQAELNESYENDDALLEHVQATIKRTGCYKYKFLLHTLLNDMGFEPSQYKQHDKEVGAALTALGFRKKQCRHNKIRGYWWWHPGYNPDGDGAISPTTVKTAIATTPLKDKASIDNLVTAAIGGAFDPQFDVIKFAKWQAQRLSADAARTVGAPSQPPPKPDS